MSRADVPAGPSRLRASDADRDKVAAVLRGQYSAGRLDDGDLERRLTRVLAARTLGQLRAQVDDLPAPSPSFGQRVANGARYGGRTLRHPAGAAVAVITILVVIGAIAGNSEQTPKLTTGHPTWIPTDTTPAEHITTVRPGGTGVDDRLAVRVRKITRRDSMRLTYGKPDQVFPGPGHVFAVVDVEYSNRTSKSMRPFCGSDAAKLFSRAHRGFDTVDREYEMVGNDAMCGDGIEPDETATAYLVFEVPKGTRFKWIDVWNGDTNGGDLLGRTRLRMRLDGVPGA